MLTTLTTGFEKDDEECHALNQHWMIDIVNHDGEKQFDISHNFLFSFCEEQSGLADKELTGDVKRRSWGLRSVWRRSWRTGSEVLPDRTLRRPDSAAARISRHI